MKTHRFAVAFVALALLVSSFAYTIGIATAAGPVQDSVVVTGTVSDTISISLNRHTIRFGDGLTFLGSTGANSDAVDVCTNPAHTGITGARFVGPNVVVTVVSSRAYSVGRGSYDLAAELNTRGWVGSGNYDGCGGTNMMAAHSVPYVVLNPVLGTSSNGTPLAGTAYNEFYMFDVRVDDPAGSYSSTIIYAASQTP